jgi:hypothetical protein
MAHLLSNRANEKVYIVEEHTKLKMMKILQKIVFMAFVFTSVNTYSFTNDDKPVKSFQLSVIPMVGTDGTDAINNRYRLSFNVFGGITGGVQGLELGGFINISNGFVEGLQLAGFGNVVNGNQKGLQGAGFMNIQNGSASGLKGSGFINVTNGNFEGLQGTGFLNVVSGNNQGVNGAGFGNITRGNLKGVSGAGFMNIVGTDAEGVMGAGFMNVTRGNQKGLQGAGFANISGGDVQGPQAAGFLNLARDIEGIQVSGFLNVASEMKGIQLGFINISDTITGIPVGFLSIVRKGGYRAFEMFASDALQMGASFKIGVPVFYNIFTLGVRPFDSQFITGTGYGLGTNIYFNENSTLQIEGHTTHLHPEWKLWSGSWENMINELRFTFGFRTGERVEWFAGPVIYNQVYKNDHSIDFEEPGIAPYTLHESSWYGHTYLWWIGVRGGVRLLF